MTDFVERCGGGAREPFAAAGCAPKHVADRPFEVRATAVSLEVDLEDRSIRGSVEHRGAALADDAAALVLDAVALDIEEVRVDGGAVEWSHDGERLRIRPRTPFKKGSEHALLVRYRGRPERGVWFVAPDAARPGRPLQAWTQGQDEDTRFWIPCFDSPNQKATTEMTVAVPRGYEAVSNGALVSREDRGDKTVFRWAERARHSPYLITLVVGTFDVVLDRAGALPLRYLAPKGRGGDARRTFGATPRMIELFGRLFGAPYAFEKYDQVVVSDFIFGGMENTSATTLYEYVMLDASVEDSADSDWLVAHELAHQWFGDLLTCREWAHGWLNEGFATYSEALWYEHGASRDRGRHHLLGLSRSYFDEARDAYRRPIVCRTYDAAGDLFDRHLYEKGACVLHHLRTELGDDAFFASLRRYVASHREGSVETVDLRRAVEAETGRNLDAFFDQWVFAPGHPEFQVRSDYDASKRRLSLTVRQTQDRSQGTPVFSARTTVRVWTAAEALDFPVEISSAEHRFQFDLPADPAGVRFAAEGAPLFVIDFERPDGWLETQLRRDDDLFGRAEAAAALGRSGSRAAVAALVRALKDDPSWLRASEVAAALGATRVDEALEALVGSLGAKEPRARAASAQALGRFRDARAAAALSRVATSDRSPLVRAHALRAVGRTRQEESADLLTKAATETGTWNDVVPRYAIWGLSEFRRTADEALFSRECGPGRPELVRAEALRALAELGSGLDDKTPIRRRLEDVAEERGFHAVRAAIGALRMLGDPRGADVLDRVASRRFVDGRIKRAARAAARALRTDVDAREALRSLQDRATKQEDEHRKVLQRLESLEGGRPAPKSRRPKARGRGPKRRRRG